MDPDSRILHGHKLDMPIWRYMSLSAFIRMIQDLTVHIPTLEFLQRDDPSEGGHGKNLSVFPAPRFDGLSDINIRRWLVQHLSDDDRIACHVATSDAHDPVYDAIEEDILRSRWLLEIAKRRLAWCWYGVREESMAQWRLYAMQGIAIKSTPRQIIEALNVGQFDLPVEAWPVYYAASPLKTDQHDCPSDDEVLRRPFIVKSNVFDHEKEIRFVFPKQNQSISRSSGVTVRLKNLDFIQSVKTSPYLHAGEDKAICELVDFRLGRRVASVSAALCPEQLISGPLPSGVYVKQESDYLNCIYGVPNPEDSPDFFDHL